jgi:glucose/arabinose dehydrogenase
MTSRHRALTVLVSVASLAAASCASAAPSIRLVPVATKLNQPLGLVSAPGTAQLYIVQQGGKIRVLSGKVLRSQPFLDVESRITSGGERGLLGLAFHPKYAANGRFYVNYTDKGGDTNIVEFRRSSNPNVADPASARVLLKVDQPFENHNGGGLAFGPDGKLYIALGDGGSGGDPQGNGQRLDTHLGKILRIDVDAGSPFGVPSNNPFVGRSGAKPEIWHYGLRNPWRISFDRANGDLYIGDVGQGSWEEIDRAPKGVGGRNYGWNNREGRHAFGGGNGANGKTFDPVGEYSHSKGCSVTGGYVYRGKAVASLKGRYVFADYCSARFWTIAAGSRPGSLVEITGKLDRKVDNPTSFGQDNAGELYVVSGGGTVYRFANR